MSSQVSWDQDCSSSILPLAVGLGLRQVANCDHSSESSRKESSSEHDCAPNALEAPHLTILRALNLVAQGVNVSYTPQVATQRPEWEAFERDIALLLPKNQRPQWPRQEFASCPDIGRQESRAEQLLADPRFLEPAPPRFGWCRPEPPEFSKRREEVSRPLRPRAPPALQAVHGRRDQGNFRRLASIGALALGVVFCLGCYQAAFGTGSIADVRAITFVSTLVPKLTLSLSTWLPGVFD